MDAIKQKVNCLITLGESLKAVPNAVRWVTKNTAILIVHGIGDQVPLATLDDFSRGLIQEYKTTFPDRMLLSHELMPKSSGIDKWFDNVLRIKNSESDFVVDIYEYYWANYTEDKASWTDLDKWINGVVKGASNFYHQGENSDLGIRYGDDSFFFTKKTKDSPRKFNAFRYKLFLGFFGRLVMMVSFLISGIISLITYIPFIGGLASSLAKSFGSTFLHDLVNVIGDISIYNVVDPKSKFYCVRKQIAEGAINALRYLIEKPADTKLLNKIEEDFQEGIIDQDDYDKALLSMEHYYGSVILAGHSLGSQIAYDSINKLNLLLNENEIAHYQINSTRTEATSKLGNSGSIVNRFNGFITFGSPLDKIMFFLREQIPKEQFIKQQILTHYHGFKQRPVGDYFQCLNEGTYVKAECGLIRLLDDMKWRNYYDKKDYVSGGLDYYHEVTNVDCNFQVTGKTAFTHSNYWADRYFFRDIINNFLT
ncbi:MAG: hypothetical protein EOO43_03205 [Flavobacterium sp.]|nr:MAG: hypothetical protein EOO43_03205 [Flavobacterium sp.]